MGRPPFLNEADLHVDLSAGPLLPTGSRFKYSNHGYGLLGLTIEAITDELYADWVACEAGAAAGRKETVPDAPLAAGVPFARGQSRRWQLGQRVLIPGDNPTHALAAATGFMSTAAALARFQERSLGCGLPHHPFNVIVGRHSICRSRASTS